MGVKELTKLVGIATAIDWSDGFRFSISFFVSNFVYVEVSCSKVDILGLKTIEDYFKEHPQCSQLNSQDYVTFITHIEHFVQ